MAKSNTLTIGKYVLENLTTGMYNEPLCIYREYIQNSADAVDKAVATGQLTTNKAEIYIQVDEAACQVVFEDNGTGIARAEALATLRNIAQSDKIIGKDRGFRGIGRLGGLGYCDELVFETSYAGEPTKSLMRWDARLLKQLVHDRTTKQSVSEVLNAIITYEDTLEEEVDKHYFKVIMSGVTNATLLDVDEVKNYLRMVAPLPFEAGFVFRSKIKESAAEFDINLDEYSIYFNQEKLYKAYTTQLYKENNDKRESIGEIKDLVFFHEYSKNGELLYWGWRSVSNIQNIRLTAVNKARGLRLRKGNIQIGDSHLLEKCFKDGESRFHFYVVGEVYAFSTDLIPNGRRDDFEDSPLYSEFKYQLRSVCNAIQRLANDASDITSAQRKIEAVQKTQDELKATLAKGVTSKDEVELLQSKLLQKKNEADGATKKLDKFKRNIAANNDAVLGRIFQEIVKPIHENDDKQESIPVIQVNEQKLVFRSDKLSKLDKRERKLIGQVFDVINKVLAKDLAENLIQKLEEKFK